MKKRIWPGVIVAVACAIWVGLFFWFLAIDLPAAAVVLVIATVAGLAAATSESNNWNGD